MILKTSIKTLTLLLAVGVTYTTGSNLRQRRTALFQHHGANTVTTNLAPAATEKQLRSPSASADEEKVDAATATEFETSSTTYEPSIALDKSTYVESEQITASFSVGPPNHPYYSSSDAPSLNLDNNYPQWSIGLFMRDADPQGGTLSPIVSINVCGLLGDKCDADDRNFENYNDLSVTFGSEYDLMQGQWPLEISDYGTGFDVYVLDAKGAAAIGPLEFSLVSEDDEMGSNVGGSVYRPNDEGESATENIAQPPALATSNPLLKYHKGTAKSTQRQHATVSKASAAHANVKIAEANGLEMSSNVIPSEDSIHKIAKSEESSVPSKSSISSNKDEYEDDDSVTLNFSLELPSSDISGYRVGIFMRMAHPQGGALQPIVSLPLCSENGCDSISGLTTGSVTFNSESMELMTPAPQWPIDLYQWGTGFDAYVLDESGSDVVGPVKFNIMMDDTY